MKRSDFIDMMRAEAFERETEGDEVLHLSDAERILEVALDHFEERFNGVFSCINNAMEDAKEDAEVITKDIY